MKKLYLSILITFVFINNSFSVDFTNINKKEQATIYQNERNSIKEKYENVIEKIKNKRDSNIAEIKKENKKSQFNKIILEHKKYLTLSRSLREEYLKELTVLKETYKYYNSIK